MGSKYQPTVQCNIKFKEWSVLRTISPKTRYMILSLVPLDIFSKKSVAGITYKSEGIITMTG